jgi:hypothetical protein
MLNIDMNSFGGEPIGETNGHALLAFVLSTRELDSDTGSGLLMREDVGIISHNAVASSLVGLDGVDEGEDLKMDEADSYDVAISAAKESAIWCSSPLLKASPLAIEIGMKFQKFLSASGDVFMRSEHHILSYTSCGWNKWRPPQSNRMHPLLPA